MKKYVAIMIGFAFLVTACKKDKTTVTNPTNPNEEELITTFKITFTDVNGVLPAVEAQFVDIDGVGGNDPTTFDSIFLAPNATYAANITLLNESASPVEDITAEVEEEGVDHLFCFELSAGLNMVITRTDLDANNLPIGIQSQWVTTSASSGTSTIRLRHQPGVKTGDCAPGETDIELTFQTYIQ